MAEDKENPLSRWSRRKHESARAERAPDPAPAAPADAAGSAPPALPPLDQLGAESDFSAFMDKRVDDGLRRLALKKLFRDPRFNVTDGLDVYAEDYSKLGDLPPELVDTLEHVRRTLRRGEPEPQPAAGAPQEHGAAPESRDEPQDAAPPVAQPPEAPPPPAAEEDARRSGAGDGENETEV